MSASSLTAADYYLSSTGDDGANGVSTRTAWRTLERAARARFRGGDRILLRGGDTFHGSLSARAVPDTSAKQPLVIGSYGRGRAVVISPDASAIQLLDMGGVVVENLELRGLDRKRNKGSGIRLRNTRPGADKREFVRIRRIIASGFGFAGIEVMGKPADNSQSGFADVVIENCEAFDNQYYGILVDGIWDPAAVGYANRNVIVRDCLLHDNSGDPAFLQNHSGSGIKMDATDGGLIEFTSAWNNGFENRSTAGGPCGIWTHGSNDITIQFNVSYRNRSVSPVDGCGFDFDAGVSNSKLQYNYSAENDGAGYLLFTYQPAPHRFVNNIVRGNISHNDGRNNAYSSFHISNHGTGIENLQVTGNTVYLSERGPNAKKPGAEWPAFLVERTEGVVLRNNIIVASGAVPVLHIGGALPGLVWENNLYWNDAGRFLIRDGGREFSAGEAWHAAMRRDPRARFVDPKLQHVREPQLPLRARELRSLRALALGPGTPAGGLGAAIPAAIASTRNSAR